VNSKTYLGCNFVHIEQVELERDGNGGAIEYMPHQRYKKASSTGLHRFGAGPFCRFHPAKGIGLPGIYIVTADDALCYIGECINLDKRWGSNGYGNISPRNPYVGGQPTNCRINNAILKDTKIGKRIDLWFHNFKGEKEHRLKLEKKLIEKLTPNWNIAHIGQGKQTK